MGIMAYFSKADWASPYYWNPETMQGETSRHANYDTGKKPELWNKFVEYTHAQMMELVDGYGPFDGFWLDAGWVNAREGEDIRLEKIASDARKKNSRIAFCGQNRGRCTGKLFDTRVYGAAGSDGCSVGKLHYLGAGRRGMGLYLCSELQIRTRDFAFAH